MDASTTLSNHPPAGPGPTSRARRRAVTAALAVVTVAAVGAVSAYAATAPTSYSYASSANMPNGGTVEAGSALVGGKLHVLGGFKLQQRSYVYEPTALHWVYTAATKKWAMAAPLPAAVSHSGIDSDGARYIWYAGGYRPDPSVGTNPLTAIAQAWQYDSTTGSYTALPDLPARRGAGGLAYLPRTVSVTSPTTGAITSTLVRRLYFFGGTNIDRTVDSTSVWSLDLDHLAAGWTTRAPLRNARNHLGWGVIGGKLYIVGGMHLTASETAQPDLDRYDPATDTWTRLADMPTPRDHIMDSTFVDRDGRLVTAGGWSRQGISNVVQAYVPGTGSWQSLTAMPKPRTSQTACGFADGSFIATAGSASLYAYQGYLATPH